MQDIDLLMASITISPIENVQQGFVEVLLGAILLSS